ncbi:tail fiber/spike domain-containing protein [Providencia manganoxydans]|uniref:tail fiber/spike domain-containing protein n=1 Tax=Providencia manganoxydans TaxID=2923283 RepID=UPI0029C0FF01|nr:hypothetical protein [Providencia manganoxydans]MDX4944006.1 hypothetical protein [Providencia manganoxydans]
MTTYNTKDPLGSASVKNLYDNSENLDRAVNDRESETWTDRLDNERISWHGMEMQNRRLIEKFNQDMLNAILAAGYAPIGTFKEGAEVKQRNEVVLWEKPDGDGEYYRCDGDLPKLVPENSTPETTGGIKSESNPNGIWVGVGDASLRGDLKTEKGAALVGLSQTENYPSGSVGDAIKSIRVNISSLGLSDRLEDENKNAVLLNEKLSELYQRGVTEIYMDKSPPVNPGYNYQTHVYERRVTHMTDFKFYGPGQFISSTPYNGLYNAHIEDKLCSEPISTNTSNIKINKLKKKDLKVVIMGDSISLDWADSLTLGVCQWSIIKAELQAQNPEYTFTFVNRAIGGMRWSHANTKPSAFPSWYTDHTKNWVDYIIQENADIVILAFGMNDSDSFNAGTMISTINKLKAGLPHAHYIMCTCLVPSRGNDYNQGVGFDGLRWQEGRNFAAGFERTYAKWAGFSVFDFNRYFVQARDGKDQVACELQEIPNQEPTNGAYTADACVDFAFEALISGWDKSKVIYINSGGDSSEDWIYIGVDTSNNFVVTGRTEYMNAYYSKTTDIQVPSGDFWLVTTVINNECNIYIGLDPTQEPKDGTDNVFITSFHMVRHGGTVRPKIGMGGVQSGNISKIRVMLGQPTQRKKIITDREMWGLGNNLADRKMPYGGNGINHPSGQGLAKIITPVMQSQDLRIKFSQLELPITRQPNVNPYMNNYPSATVIDGIIYLSGSVYGSGASQGATIFNISRYSEFNKPTRLVQAFGNGGGTGWGTRILRFESNGDVKIEVGDCTGGLLLDGISFNLI